MFSLIIIKNVPNTYEKIFYTICLQNPNFINKLLVFLSKNYTKLCKFENV